MKKEQQQSTSSPSGESETTPTAASRLKLTEEERQQVGHLPATALLAGINLTVEAKEDHTVRPATRTSRKDHLDSTPGPDEIKGVNLEIDVGTVTFKKRASGTNEKK